MFSVAESENSYHEELFKLFYLYFTAYTQSEEEEEEEEFPLTLKRKGNKGRSSGPIAPIAAVEKKRAVGAAREQPSTTPIPVPPPIVPTITSSEKEALGRPFGQPDPSSHASHAQLAAQQKEKTPLPLQEKIPLPLQQESKTLPPQEKLQQPLLSEETKQQLTPKPAHLESLRDSLPQPAQTAKIAVAAALPQREPIAAPNRPPLLEEAKAFMPPFVPPLQEGKIAFPASLSQEAKLAISPTTPPVQLPQPAKTAPAAPFLQEPKAAIAPTPLPQEAKAPAPPEKPPLPAALLDPQLSATAQTQKGKITLPETLLSAMSSSHTPVATAAQTAPSLTKPTPSSTLAAPNASEMRKESPLQQLTKEALSASQQPMTHTELNRAAPISLFMRESPASLARAPSLERPASPAQPLPSPVAPAAPLSLSMRESPASLAGAPSLERPASPTILNSPISKSASLPSYTAEIASPLSAAATPITTSTPTSPQQAQIAPPEISAAQSSPLFLVPTPAVANAAAPILPAGDIAAPAAAPVAAPVLKEAAEEAPLPPPSAPPVPPSVEVPRSSIPPSPLLPPSALLMFAIMVVTSSTIRVESESYSSLGIPPEHRKPLWDVR